MRIISTLILLLTLVSTPLMASNPNEANEAYKSGDYERAEELYRAAIEADPINAKLYFNLGNTLTALGRSDEAIQFYAQYISLAQSPEEKALGEYNIGHIHGVTEKWDQAGEHFKRSLILNPNDEDAKYNYQLARQKQQEQQQDQQQQNQPPPEPSEYAKRIKEQAEQLVAQQRYADALKVMQDGLKADETVAAFNDFTKRIGDVVTVNSN